MYTTDFANMCNFFVTNSSSITAYLDLNRIVTRCAESAVESFDNALNIESEPNILLNVVEIVMKECAQELLTYIESKFSVYDLLDDDLVKGEGYSLLASITEDYYAHGLSVERRISLNADIQRARAHRIAESKVTGLGFGIISNSLASHLLYIAQNEAAIRKQAAEAEKYLSLMEEQISRQSDNQLRLAQQQYFRTNFAPQMRSAIPFVYADMLARSVAFLAERDCINANMIESFDFERSQAILAKADNLSDSLEKIIESALRLCPYNVHIYAKAKLSGLFNDTLQSLAASLDLVNAIQQLTGLSMIDESANCDQIDIEIGEFTHENMHFVDKDDWRSLSAQFVRQAKNLVSKNKNSHAAHGAYAAFLVAANVDTPSPEIWREVEHHILLMHKLFFQRDRIARKALREPDDNYDIEAFDAWEAYSTWYDSYHNIMIAFRKFCGRYSATSRMCSSTDTWSCATSSQQWKMMSDCKRRMLPLIQTTETLLAFLINEREDFESTFSSHPDYQYNFSKKRKESGTGIFTYETVFDYVTTNQIAFLRGDLLWYLYVFGKYDHDCVSSPSGQIVHRYYHLPLEERSASIARFDELLASEKVAVVKAGFYHQERTSNSPDIFRNEISDEGLRYFGLVPPVSRTNTRPSASSESGGCYIATCVYGSYDCPEVWTLRRFRDLVLSTTWYGRAFINTYYTISPKLVKLFGGTHLFRSMWKGILNRLVTTLMDKGIDNSPYEDAKPK